MHCILGHPTTGLLLPSAASYLDVSYLVELVKQHSIDAVHPGYGFLSESAEFAYRMWHEAGAMVIGPGWDVLAQTGDKLQAKQLAVECGVPVLEAMAHPTSSIAEAFEFATNVGFPVMVKATDGGGGRGIRLVRERHELENSFNRAIGESPSKSVFLEKAAIDGFHHIEVQIIGDSSGHIQHLWERDCSIQRRFQKVVEFAPSLIRDRALIGRVIDSAVKMASQINYRSLGTFEFLVSESADQFFFLEINPRIQVEHTITESITGFDLVQIQLLIAQGHTMKGLGLGTSCDPFDAPPNTFSMQLRVCAENPSKDFALSVGEINKFIIPGGNGIRLDTHVNVGQNMMTVGTNFDNLLAKIVITGATWEAVVRKAQRVLQDSEIEGVQTNIGFLKGVLAHADFLAGKTDTQWLGRNVDVILQAINTEPQEMRNNAVGLDVQQTSGTSPQIGDTWQVAMQGLPKDGKRQGGQFSGHLRLLSIVQNDLPAALIADVECTPLSSDLSSDVGGTYRMEVKYTAGDGPVLQRRGDPANPHHILFPLPGKLVEIMVSPGQDIVKNQSLAYVKQMKMELEVRSPRSGTVKWVYEMMGDGDDVEEGMLLVELEPYKTVQGKL